MRYFGYLAMAFALIFTALSCDDDDVTPADDIDVPDGYTLLWHDEFNDNAIDPENWDFQLGDGRDYNLPPGWGNRELQIYTSNSDNADITKDGDVSALRITAREDGAGGYTSARLFTRDLVSFRFGRIDVRAKLPEGQGVWPAIWLLGENIDQVDWPGCGEIDICELLGNDPWTYYATVHYVNGENRKGEIQGLKELSGDRFSDDYHVFSLDWTPESMTFLLDDEQIKEIPIEDDMKEFLRSFYMILNVAVGGNWPGDPDNSTVFPQSMLVDYVRLFYRNGFTPDAPPVLDIEEETIGQILEPNIADNAFRDDFDEFGTKEVIAFGGGGEPYIATSDTAINGDLSLAFNYPGGAWGGAYIQLEEAVNVSQYNFLKFSLFMTAEIADAEIKLESALSEAAVFLRDYTGVDVGQGFVEYTIPMSDFEGLDVFQLTIPFALWNPKDANEDFPTFTALIDNIYMTE